MAAQLTRRIDRATLERRLTRPAPSTPVAPVEAPALEAAVDEGPDARQLAEWLGRLQLLHGVPFNYLVPDIGMSPVESIRFFQVDSNWLAALVDGALSLGGAGGAELPTLQARPRLLASARERLTRLRSELLGQTEALEDTPAPEAMSGFLLRSAVTSGWPGMEVSGFSDGDGTQPLRLLRLERLAPTLLLGLFAGTLQRLDLHEPSEGLHFGVERTPTDPTKTLRYANSGGGVQAGDPIPNLELSVPMRATGDGTVLRVNALAQSMATRVWAPRTPTRQRVTSAQFALEMVQGIGRVTFRALSTP